MTDRICVVTGANTGIGKETALGLARMGARVVLACRSEDKTRPVMDEIAGETGTTPEFLALDLGSFEAVRAAAAELLERGHPIHVLVNNAGLAGQRGETADGFELQFGVNHLGPYLFTRLLLDRIIESAPARIVNVASASHYQVKGAVDWNVKGKTRSVTGLKEYERSKLANVLFTVELAKRLEGTGVTTYSLHPGVIASDIWRRLPWPVRPVAKKFMKSPEEGAQTSIYCASAPELAGETGLYYDDCKQKRPSRLARDEALATEMWNRSADWVGLPAD